MWLKIKPRQPLILGEVRADSQFLTSQTYIPGRILRGAWAEWLVNQGRTDDEILATVGRLRLGNFFPAAEWRHLDYVLPLPMSAMTCKREPGFSGEPLPTRRGHGVVDVLLPSLAYRLLAQQGAQFPVPFAADCAQCGDRLEPMAGFYAVYRNGNHRYYVLFRPRYYAQTKVAISRARRASAEGMLYTASALSPRTPTPDKKREETTIVFLGRVHGHAEALDDLKEALNNVPLGALHTRGYGRVEVEDAEASLPSLTERLEAFNTTLTTLWGDNRRLAANAETLPDQPAGIYFSVDLLAPGVFHEDGIPALRPLLQIGGQTLAPICWLTRPDMASGWSTAWGLPKPTNLAARMGSVYVFRWDGSKDDLIPALQSLEEQGIGERRDEGFGECLICHPFHQEVEER
ncbi:MAG: type III-D CRISPR-associated RAMP protein Csx10 [Anaerolineae bacterium]